MKIQRDFVKNSLEKKGRVSRNQCLKRYITRLGSRVWDLKQEGYPITGGYEKTRYGMDYVYRLIK